MSKNDPGRRATTAASTSSNPFEAERRALDLPPTLSKKEAAALAKVSVRSIDRAIAVGFLPAVRAARRGSSRVIIRAADLLRYLGVGAEV